MEIVFTGFVSGLQGNPRLISQTYLWMFPIYGLAVLLEPLHKAICAWPWYFRGFIWVLVIWVIELTTGGLIRAVVGTSPWIYKDGRHIMGLVQINMAPLWFGVGLLFEQVHYRLVGKDLVFYQWTKYR